MIQRFERCLPEEVGIPSEAIDAFLDELENGGFTQMHGLMIMRHGKVCAEGWWAPFAPGLHHCDHSLSKTYTATAIGLAEYQGLLKLSDRVCDILPDKMPAQMSDRLSRLTIRDLLVMGDGSEEEETTYPAEWLERYFARPIAHEPGTFWRYNSHTTAVLSAIIERLTGGSMLDYLAKNLFDLIGIDAQNVMCRRGADGTCLGGMGMFTTTEDNLRLMKLYLNGGVWNGVRLLSETFVHDATTERMDTWPAHAHTPYIYDNCVGYGYQIWMCRPEGSYRADGAFGQFSVVVPSLDLIVSINEAGFLGELMGHSDLHLLKEGENHPIHGPQATLNALFDILVPQIHADVETLPVDKAAGDEVSSGTVNQYGAFEMRATKVGEDSSIQRMIRLVQSADAGKAKIVRLADRWATWIVVIALTAAALTWLISGEIIRAVTILVVFCPCALVLATPTAIMAAIGNSTRHGFLIREGDALERLAKVSYVAFDKTGTLTLGTPQVVAVRSFQEPISPETLFSWAASAEQRSEHPLGKAVVSCFKQKYGEKLPDPHSFSMIPGRGVKAEIIDSDRILAITAGNREMFQDEQISLSDAICQAADSYIKEGCTLIFVAADGQAAGLIALSDTLRPDAAKTIRGVKSAGLSPILLTGDHESAARHIADTLSIKELRWNCLPEDKLNWIGKSQKNGQMVCMIGDGVNDAPRSEKRLM